MGMKAIPLRDLGSNGFFTASAYIDERYIILTPETPVTQGLVNRLSEWEIRQVYTDGELASDAPVAETPEDIAAAIAAEGEAESKPISTQADGDRESLDKVSAFYEQFLKYVETVYTRYVTKNDIVLKELSDRVKNFCDMITENRRYVLRIMSRVTPSSNYLVNHSVRSTVLAVVLGTQIKLPPHRLIELGVAAVLHEIGMVRLPPQLYMADRPLTQVEFKSITAHPILGYNILKEKQFPLAVCLAALEHHERMNGSGYPRALTGDKISVYAKIIAVACSYDAVTASRPYREAREGYEGMVDLLKNEGKKYDDLVIKALVYAMSIFPIGSYVLLTNGRAGQVVDVNPENPRYPVILVLGSKTADGKETLIQTAENGVRILRPLSRNEIDRHSPAS